MVAGLSTAVWMIAALNGVLSAPLAATEGPLSASAAAQDAAATPLRAALALARHSKAGTLDLDAIMKLLGVHAQNAHTKYNDIMTNKMSALDLAKALLANILASHMRRGTVQPASSVFMRLAKHPKDAVSHVKTVPPVSDALASHGERENGSVVIATGGTRTTSEVVPTTESARVTRSTLATRGNLTGVKPFLNVTSSSVPTTSVGLPLAGSDVQQSGDSGYQQESEGISKIHEGSKATPEPVRTDGWHSAEKLASVNTEHMLEVVASQDQVVDEATITTKKSEMESLMTEHEAMANTDYTTTFVPLANAEAQTSTEPDTGISPIHLDAQVVPNNEYQELGKRPLGIGAEAHTISDEAMLTAKPLQNWTTVVTRESSKGTTVLFNNESSQHLTDEVTTELAEGLTLASNNESSNEPNFEPTNNYTQAPTSTLFTESPTNETFEITTELPKRSTYSVTDESSQGGRKPGANLNAGSELRTSSNSSLSSPPVPTSFAPTGTTTVKDGISQIAEFQVTVTAVPPNTETRTETHALNIEVIEDAVEISEKSDTETATTRTVDAIRNTTSETSIELVSAGWSSSTDASSTDFNTLKTSVSTHSPTVQVATEELNVVHNPSKTAHSQRKRTEEAAQQKDNSLGFLPAPSTPVRTGTIASTTTEDEFVIGDAPVLIGRRPASVPTSTEDEFIIGDAPVLIGRRQASAPTSTGDGFIIGDAPVLIGSKPASVPTSTEDEFVIGDAPVLIGSRPASAPTQRPQDSDSTTQDFGQIVNETISTTEVRPSGTETASSAPISFETTADISGATHANSRADLDDEGQVRGATEGAPAMFSSTGFSQVTASTLFTGTPETTSGQSVEETVATSPSLSITTISPPAKNPDVTSLTSSDEFPNTSTSSSAPTPTLQSVTDGSATEPSPSTTSTLKEQSATAKESVAMTMPPTEANNKFSIESSPVTDSQLGTSEATPGQSVEETAATSPSLSITITPPAKNTDVTSLTSSNDFLVTSTSSSASTTTLQSVTEESATEPSTSTTVIPTEQSATTKENRTTTLFPKETITESGTTLTTTSQREDRTEAPVISSKPTTANDKPSFDDIRQLQAPLRTLLIAKMGSKFANFSHHFQKPNLTNPFPDIAEIVTKALEEVRIDDLRSVTKRSTEIEQHQLRFIVNGVTVVMTIPRQPEFLQAGPTLVTDLVIDRKQMYVQLQLHFSNVSVPVNFSVTADLFPPFFTIRQTSGSAVVGVGEILVPMRIPYQLYFQKRRQDLGETAVGVLMPEDFITHGISMLNVSTRIVGCRNSDFMQRRVLRFEERMKNMLELWLSRRPLASLTQALHHRLLDTVRQPATMAFRHSTAAGAGTNRIPTAQLTADGSHSTAHSGR